MTKIKRKINKQSVMQKQQWKYMRRRYPFLVPVRHWYTGMKMTKEEIKNTPPILSLESRDIPDGWVNRFGHELCEELRAELIRCGCLNSDFVVMAKEKFGELRLCLAGTPKECKADDIIDKYSEISRHVCARCGKMDTPMINYGGWYIPYCKECYEYNQSFKDGWSMSDITYEESVISVKDEMTPRKLTWIMADDKQQEIDISDTVDKLREKHINKYTDILPHYRKGDK